MATFTTFSQHRRAAMGPVMSTHLGNERSSNERLAIESVRLREIAKLMPAGAERDELLRRAGRLDVASHLDSWLSSRELKPPS
jgi:hypothetical protein